MAILSNVNGKFAVDSTGAVQFSGAAGTSGYVLKSNGSGSAPTWVDVSTVIGGPYLPLSGGTLTGATATASGISFTVGGVLTANDTSKIEKAQITTQFDTSSFLRLHPSATTNSGGFTNMIFGTDTANNYGVAIGGKREGTDGTPTFSIRMLDDSITGTEVLNISNSGNATFAGNVILGDTPQIQLGTGNDAQIDHTGSHLFIDNSVGNSYLRNTSTGSIIIRNGTGGDIQFDNEFAGNILFNTSNITRLTIDSSGNVGIGVTPSTIWSSSYNALQIGLGGSVYAHSSAGSSLNLGANIVYEGTAPNYYDKYLTSSTATKYQQDAGIHIWSTAVSGTAGNAVSWSERMRIDSSGNVGISSTVPEKNLSIGSAQGDGIQFNYDTTNSYRNQILNYWNSSPDSRMDFNIGRTANVAPVTVMSVGYSGNVGIGTTTPVSKLEVNGAIKASGITANIGTDPGVSLSYDTSNNIGLIETWTSKPLLTRTYNYQAFDISGSEKMRITSGGVGIGITNPTRQLSVLDRINIKASSTSGSANLLFGDSDDDGIGQIKYDNSDNSMRFQVNNTQRMRITSGGYVIIGDSSTAIGGQLTVDNSANTNDTLLRLEDAGGTGTHTQIEFRNTNGTVGTITTVGTTTAYNTSSDYRLKENIVEMAGALDRVSQLKPSRFNFITDADKTVDGFLAHEVQEIVPEAITGQKDAVDKDGNPDYQGIDQSKLVPLLVGAIQELKAEIEILKNK